MNMIADEPVIETGTSQARCLRDAITLALRDRLRAGEWRTGDRIPPNEQLAIIYKTSTFTVHKALTPLVEEGLLERRRRLGTFVRPGCEAGLRPATDCTALVMHGGFSDTDGSGKYLQQLMFYLQRRIDNTPGSASRLWSMPSRGRDDPGPAAQVVKAYEAGRIARAVVVSTSAAALAALRAAGIPLGVSTTSGEPDSANFDPRHFCELSVGDLVRSGCRRIGLITNAWDPEAEPPEDGAPMSLTTLLFHRAWREVLPSFGLELRPEWVTYASRAFHPYAMLGESGEPSLRPRFIEYGYRAFMRLWDRAERPDGLVVYSDQVALGVTMAMLERGVSVPKELRVVFHKNKHIELHVPFPVTLVTSDEQDMAEILIRLAHNDIQGPVWLPYRLSRSEGL